MLYEPRINGTKLGIPEQTALGEFNFGIYGRQKQGWILSSVAVW